MLNMDAMPVKHNPPDPRAIKLLREKGYAEYDVQRIASRLARDQQWSPQHPVIHEAMWNLFIKQYIVPSVASALQNEAERAKSRVTQ